MLNTYKRFPVEFVRGNGAFLYDVSGKEYLDFLSGIAVTGLGHNHPVLRQAVIEQINSLWHVSNLYESTPQENLAKELTNISGLNSVFFCNSGTEAVEAAIKFARKWGKGRYKIISALNSFHGRTYGSLSATGQNKFHLGFEPMLPGFSYVPFGVIDEFKKAYSDDTVAILIETIQGEGGVNVAPKGFIKELREFCDEKDILLIIDEIQTGFGRTGKFFSYQHENIIPDMVTTAKGIANGLPLGAVICSSKIAGSIQPGDHGSTFGGNLIAIAAANKVVELIDDNLLNFISKWGNTLMNSLYALDLPFVKEIRGKGLMIGIELEKNISSKKIAGLMLNESVLVGTSGDSVIRLLPPFIITQNEVMKFLLSFKKVIINLSGLIK